MLITIYMYSLEMLVLKEGIHFLSHAKTMWPVHIALSVK